MLANLCVNLVSAALMFAGFERLFDPFLRGGRVGVRLAGEGPFFCNRVKALEWS
jgi:hypothetical protein